MAQAQSTLAPSAVMAAAGQQIISYYIQHAEDAGKAPFPNCTDGYTFYRALARQVLGSPSQFQDLRDAVLQGYLRVYASDEHPLHNRFEQLDNLMKAAGCAHQLFSLLHSPDLDANEQVLEIIAHLLKIRIDVYDSIDSAGRPGSPIQSAGPQGRSVCAVLRKPCVGGQRRGMPFRFDSLLPDDSGKALIEYLQAQKKLAAQDPTDLQIRQMSWAATSDAITCFNEFRAESSEADLKYTDPRDRMDTYVVVVNESAHILPALDLLCEALRRAPHQRRWVRHSHNKKEGFMLPHVSVDAEFVKMERGAADELMGYLRRAAEDGTLEELCSVLTFAVSSRFFLCFNIVHMLETCDELTVPALSTLFRATIFDEALLKLWWNPQSDIQVLDATIAHMFQATPRAPYEHTPWEGFPTVITPRWRITHEKHFDGVRPNDLKFPTFADDPDHECEIHRPGANEQGVVCCCRLGNIDIAALFAHLAMMQGITGSLAREPWTKTRYRYRYDNLLDDMLASDRLYPMLSYAKSRAGRTGVSRDEFYQGMGKPGMECWDDVMAYNIGDVAGQNLIFEQLVCSDDREFLDWAMGKYAGAPLIGNEERKVRQRPSAFGSVGGILLWEDNPRGFEPAPATVLHDAASARFVPRGELYATETLAPWLHDRRVRMVRRWLELQVAKEAKQAAEDAEREERGSSDAGWGWGADGDKTAAWGTETTAATAKKKKLKGTAATIKPSIPRPKPQDPLLLLAMPRHPTGAYEPPTLPITTLLHTAQRDILASLRDPTRLSLPSPCTTASGPASTTLPPSPIIRAGTTHSEALLPLLHSSPRSAPRGFGARTTQPLPHTPGRGMDQARNLFTSFPSHNASLAPNLGNPQRLPPSPAPSWRVRGTVLSQREKDALFEETWRAYCSANGDDRWAAAYAAQTAAQRTLELERQKNREEGLPLGLDTRDVFDFEGREFLRRRGGVLEDVTVDAEGDVVSATEWRVGVLREKLPEWGQWGFEVVGRGGKVR